MINKEKIREINKLLEPLECPFKDAGCTDRLPRQDMNEHIESGTQHHLMMVFRSHQKLVKVNHELKIGWKDLRSRSCTIDFYTQCYEEQRVVCCRECIILDHGLNHYITA